MTQGEDLFGTTYEKGEVIFQQGDPGDTMYIIQSGAVEISSSRDNDRTVLALLDHGDFFGEMALIDSHPRSATATAISRCRLVPFTRTSILERIRHDPGVVLHLLKTLSQRILQTNRKVRALIQGDEHLRSQLILQTNRKVRALIQGDEHLRDGLVQKRENPSSTDRAQKPGDIKGRAGTPRLHDTEKHTATRVAFSPRQDECTWFSKGEFIFHQGEPGDTMYLIAEGAIEISQGTGVDRHVLALLGPGDFFGEMVLITDGKRAANAIAFKKTALLPIFREDFLQRIQAEPELALYILQGLILRLRNMLGFLSSPEKSLASVASHIPPVLKKKGRINTAVVSLATCGGCSAVLIENQQNLLQLLEKVKISYCPMLIDSEEIGEVDVAVVDGIVRVKEDEEKLLEARQKSRYLVAWGTCATFGGIPSYANHFELEDLIDESYGKAKDPFSYYLSGSQAVDRGTYQKQEDELKLLRRAGRVDEYVRVDYYLPGCPPSVPILYNLVSELRGEAQDGKPKPIVCAECSRKHVKDMVDHIWASPKPGWDKGHCFTSRGSICMGFITKGGCGAVCPRGGLACWGCRGPSETAFRKIEAGNTFEEFMLNSLLNRHRHMEDEIKLVMRIFRTQGNSSLKFNRNYFTDRSRIR